MIHFLYDALADNRLKLHDAPSCISVLASFRLDDRMELLQAVHQ